MNTNTKYFFSSDCQALTQISSLLTGISWTVLTVINRLLRGLLNMVKVCQFWLKWNKKCCSQQHTQRNHCFPAVIPLSSLGTEMQSWRDEICSWKLCIPQQRHPWTRALGRLKRSARSPSSSFQAKALQKGFSSLSELCPGPGALNKQLLQGRGTCQEDEEWIKSGLLWAKITPGSGGCRAAPGTAQCPAHGPPGRPKAALDTAQVLAGCKGPAARSAKITH